MPRWLFAFVKLVLAPWLILQGRQLRGVATRLPEPEGPREGVSGEGRVRIRLLIVGDSSAAGVGAENQLQALSGRLGEALSQRMAGAVAWQLVARTGRTTGKSLAVLRKVNLHPADVMVTALGLNDVVAQVPLHRWLAQLDKLDRIAAQRAGVCHVIHSGIPPLGLFPSLPNPLRWVLGREAKRYDHALAGWVQRWRDRWWLPLPFEPTASVDSGLMALDGFHPGPAAYALWAEQLANMIANEIAPRLPETAPTRRRDNGRPTRPSAAA